MPLVLADRVQETASAPGTGTVSLLGAVTGFQTFSSAIGNGNTTYYVIADQGGPNWEVGIGTYSTSGNTLSRDTVLSSSAGAPTKTNFSSGIQTVFVSYPAGKSVNLDASNNVSALGTVASGTWNGSTIGVAYGGTGVTASSGANSVMLRDSNQNVAVNRLNQSNTSIVSAGGTTTLTAASSFSFTLTGTTTQTFKLPDATTLATGVAFQFNNNSTGLLTIVDNGSNTIGTVAAGGAAELVCLSVSTANGSWDVHGFIPENVTWGTNALALGSTVITGGTWQGGTIGTPYGGTGLTSFASGGALYATSTSALTSGTLPPSAGGTGATGTPTNGQLLIGNGTNYTVASLTAGTGISTSVGSGSLTVTNSAPMVYPGAGIPNSTGSAWGTSYSTTGTGTVVALATSPSFTTPVLGTPTSGNLANCTGYPTSSLSGNINLATQVTGTLGTTNGGTGLTGFTAGNNAIYSTSSSALTAGTLPTAAGGTGATTFTSNGIVYGNSTSALGVTAAGTTGQVLVGNTGSAPSWSSLSSIGVTSFSAGTTGLTPNSATTGAVTLAGTLATTNGGTGLTSFTANRVFYASSTSAISQSANLTFNGTTLTVADFADSSLTAGRVTFAGTSGNLTDSANLTFTTGTGAVRAPEYEASNGVFVNNQTMSTSYTMPSGYSGMSAGPFTVGSGVTFTISSGSRHVVL